MHLPIASKRSLYAPSSRRVTVPPLDVKTPDGTKPSIPGSTKRLLRNNSGRIDSGRITISPVQAITSFKNKP